MRLSGIKYREAAQNLFKSSNIPAAVALGVVLVLGIFADYQNRAMFEQERRTEVLADISLIRARLEGNINGNLQLVRGLVSTISTEPGMSQQRFAEIASHLFEEHTQLRNIAGAPGLVVSLLYPGNSAALGLDYRKNDHQREAALRVRDTGELVLAGPVELVQGGWAFLGRFPVFIKGPGGARNFWGILSAGHRCRSAVQGQRAARSRPEDRHRDHGQGCAGRERCAVLRPRGYPRTRSGDGGCGSPVRQLADRGDPEGRLAGHAHGGLGISPGRAVRRRSSARPLLISGGLAEERRKHIAELSSREAELERLSHRLELALDVSQIGVWELDLETDEILWDDRVNELYGKPADGQPRTYSDWTNAVHPDDLQRAEEEFRTAVETRQRYSSEFRIVAPDGGGRHLRARAAIFQDASGSRKMIGAEWDVTSDVILNRDLERARDLAERRNAQLEAAKARIEYNSLHDSLTGLPNRRYLDEVLERHASRCAEHGGTAAILHIDLDRFKQINDTLGHAAGDAMLVHASAVLKSNIRTTDFVARIGGDEFVVFCMADGPDYLASLATGIIEQMRQPVSYEGHECRFGVSVGIASAAGPAVDPKRLLVNADIALYRAKRRGRSRHEFFTDELQAEIVNTKRIADEVLSGLERDEFVPYYQPQFDAKTHDIVGVEALVRWNHPTRGVQAPEYFLRIADELNVVGVIDRMILEQSLRDSAKWLAAGMVVPKVSVNVSARRLRDEELIESLRGLRFRPGSVSFELVESIFLDESDDLVARNIAQIKELGLDIEIDDFGSGHASIVSLLKLKPRRLKIDRQLVMPIVESPAQRQLVASIVEIGSSLGIDVVAEGVETMEHARILCDLGCHALQGFAFAHAMTATEFADFFQARRWRAAS